MIICFFKVMQMAEKSKQLDFSPNYSRERNANGIKYKVDEGNWNISKIFPAPSVVVVQAHGLIIIDGLSIV